MSQRLNKKVVPYGLWENDIAIESWIEQETPPIYPFRHHGTLYWLAVQANERGRIALMQENSGGQPICMTPKDFNIRTAVHEYGGRCFCIVGDDIIFNHYADGHLYWQSLTSPASPRRLSRNSNLHHCCGYADLVAVGNRTFILGVMETSREGEQNCNSLIAMPLERDAGGHIIESEPLILAQGADFYANPVVSSDGKTMAWFEWSHPNMPWDQSRLLCATIKIDRTSTMLLEQPNVVVDQPNCSVCQLGFLDDGRLIFVSDSEGCDYWSLFQYKDGNITRLTYGNEEFGEAHWSFGQCRWQPMGDAMIIAVATRADGDVLVAVDCDSTNCTVLQPGFSACSHLQYVDSSELLFIAHDSTRMAEMMSLSMPSASIRQLPRYYADESRSSAEDIDSFSTSGQATTKDKEMHCKQGHSTPSLIKFPVAEGQVAYGYFYTPCNMMYCAPKNTLPPLMVMIHGGPTGRATSAYSILKQYFCSLGFALLDINHRGSTGFGRQYRQSLLGNWGEFDADDIAAAIQFVGDKKWIDKDLVFIRGGSAGGYTVLRSLTRFPQQFAGGACYYGIGNLATLCSITHKFESKYTDRLVGEVFHRERATQPESRFITRSPVFQMDKLSSPLILFHGKEDKVVPPELSREVVKILKKKGIKHSYTEYHGEGHGFRQAQTRADALRQESAFFADIIRQKRGLIHPF